MINGRKPPPSSHAQEVLDVFASKPSLRRLFPPDLSASKTKRKNAKPESSGSGFERPHRARLQGEVRMAGGMANASTWAESPQWARGTCVSIRKEEWEPGGGKSLAASSQGGSTWIAALGGTAWLQPPRSTPCCPARREGRKDESRLCKQDCVPGKMLYQGRPS